MGLILSFESYSYPTKLIPILAPSSRNKVRSVPQRLAIRCTTLDVPSAPHKTESINQIPSGNVLLGL
ncbi:hypothetical protein CKAH01_03213 [Colletotrichum kahawae]|uniref:Uncharacterized protein n=1 Tax=Colletotrichum kahawae TaxID=34407 RepID=A0AAE0DDK8_COLKA|nr:hypothetical protein CKAH01_03213 [Colletotrichum kahawae]